MTTTTPGQFKTNCPHLSFESKAHVHRHEQTTDGVVQTTFEVTFAVRCLQCGQVMKFPGPTGLREDITVPMIAWKD